MKRTKDAPSVFLSILKTRDRRYFEELFNMITEITGLKIPGKCRFCGKKAWHIIEENVEDKAGNLLEGDSKHYLCCDSVECLSRALPELVEKLFGSIKSGLD